MLYATEIKSIAALKALLVVDLLLDETNLPLTDDPRAFAIRHILAETIRYEYGQHRATAGLTDDIERDIHSSAQACLQTQNKELICWWLLYYRYVRVDLDLSLETLHTLFAVDERTLRRYLNHAMHRLTDHLVQREWYARVQHQRRRLKVLLPSIAALTLRGREADFEVLNTFLQTSSPRHVQVSGAVGIGKTVLVQEFIRYQIEQDEIEQLVWINQPPTPQVAWQMIHDQLGLEIDLKAYTLDIKLVVVLDAVDAWLADAFAREMLKDLSGATVYVTSREPLAWLPDFKHLTLNEIGKAAAIQLTLETVGQGIEDPEDYGQEVYQLVGGNPLGVKLAAQHLRFYDKSDIEVSILNQLFGQVYSTLNTEAQRTWVALTLMPPSVLHIDHIASLWPAWVTADNIFTLLRQQIGRIDPITRTCTLTSAARHYIQKQYEVSAHIHALCNSVIDNLDCSAQAYDVVEYILLTQWPPIDTPRQRDWIYSFSAEGLQRGQYAQWLTIIDRFLPLSDTLELDLHITRALCLRHLARWEHAEEILIGVVRDAGAQGLFEQQSRALLELGILARLHGHYQQADDHYQKAYRFARRRPESDLYQAVQIERAQLAVATHKGLLAEELLQDIPPSIRVVALQAEAKLLLGDIPTAMKLTQAALTISDQQQRLHGRLNVLMGRLYEQQNDYDSAELFFTLALTFMERQDDLAGLARTRANLGSILIHKNLYYEARDLLIQSEKALMWLQDRGALLAVRHNLNVVRRRIAG